MTNVLRRGISGTSILQEIALEAGQCGVLQTKASIMKHIPNLVSNVNRLLFGLIPGSFVESRLIFLGIDLSTTLGLGEILLRSSISSPMAYE